MNGFQKVENMAKIEQKVKANPLPFWSILATFSLFKNEFKNKGYMLLNHFQIADAFLTFLKGFEGLENINKKAKK